MLFQGQHETPVKMPVTDKALNTESYMTCPDMSQRTTRNQQVGADGGKIQKETHLFELGLCFLPRSNHQLRSHRLLLQQPLRLLQLALKGQSRYRDARLKTVHNNHKSSSETEVTWRFLISFSSFIFSMNSRSLGISW